MTKYKIGFLFLGLSIVSFSHAQKKPLNHDVYDDWKSVTNAEISKSGQYIVYTVSPQEGDVLSTLTTSNHKDILRIPRGYDARLTANEEQLISLIKHNSIWFGRCGNDCGKPVRLAGRQNLEYQKTQNQAFHPNLSLLH